MRKTLTIVAPLAFAFIGASMAFGDSPIQQTAYTSSGYRVISPPRTYRAYRGGFFDRLLELERRKNEMLFGGFRR